MQEIENKCGIFSYDRDFKKQNVIKLYESSELS